MIVPMAATVLALACGNGCVMVVIINGMIHKGFMLKVESYNAVQRTWGPVCQHALQPEW